ncbi:MAG: DUF3786 domain-containing protein [Christensenellaceae bacterium]|nr:DUF3786 domain-containing protein [Christensenellaceae bacterium]
MPKNNYEQMRNEMRIHFLDYDQPEMIRKFSLKHDDKYIYIRFLARDYRISRQNGIVEGSDNGFSNTSEADYNESMTIYDILCCSKPDCALSGKYALSSSLKGIIHTGWNVGGGTMFQQFSDTFDKLFDRLPYACELLGGVPEGRGDISYRIPMFDFLPVLFSFWRSDDEFPADIRLLWDTNVLDFMHYETLWFAAGHLMRRLEEGLR